MTVVYDSAFNSESWFVACELAKDITVYNLYDSAFILGNPGLLPVSLLPPPLHTGHSAEPASLYTLAAQSG